MLHWIFFLRYPDGVPLDEGERWNLGTHTQEAKQMLGLCRYVSWRAARASWAQQRAGGSQRPAWDRLTDLTFRSMDAWREGAVEQMPRWTPAPYGPAGFLSETAFIHQTPEYDLLQEIPGLL